MRSGRNIWGRLFDGRSTTTRPIFYKNMAIVHILIDFLAEIAYSDNRRRLLEKQTHKNAFAVEMQAVVEGGEHGGSQRWQLTIIHLA